jgi:hypothetical protein
LEIKLFADAGQMFKSAERESEPTFTAYEETKFYHFRTDDASLEEPQMQRST